MARHYCSQRGCTLTEMFIVFAILSLLLGILGGTVSHTLQKRREQQRLAAQRLAVVAAVLPAYRALTGRAYPSSFAELHRLGLLSPLRLDAWHPPLALDRSPASHGRAAVRAPAPRPLPWRRIGALLLLLLPLLLLRRWAAPVKAAV